MFMCYFFNPIVYVFFYVRESLTEVFYDILFWTFNIRPCILMNGRKLAEAENALYWVYFGEWEKVLNKSKL